MANLGALQRAEKAVEKWDDGDMINLLPYMVAALKQTIVALGLKKKYPKIMGIHRSEVDY